MKMETGRMTVMLALLAGATGSGVWATDVGMPMFKAEDGRHGNVEVYYEKFSRDVELSGVNLPGLEAPLNGRQDEDRFLAGLNVITCSRASIHVEAGSTDVDESDRARPIFGAGFKCKAYDGDALQLSVFASVTYAGGIEYTAEGYAAPEGEVPGYTQEEKYFEFNGGLAVSRRLSLGGRFACTPYGGAMVSKLDGDEDYALTFRDGTRHAAGGDIQGDGDICLFAGLGVTLDQAFGVRVEGRFLNQTSFSAGLMYCF